MDQLAKWAGNLPDGQRHAIVFGCMAWFLVAGFTVVWLHIRKARRLSGLITRNKANLAKAIEHHQRDVLGVSIRTTMAALTLAILTIASFYLIGAAMWIAQSGSMSPFRAATNAFFAALGSVGVQLVEYLPERWAKRLDG